MPVTRLCRSLWGSPAIASSEQLEPSNSLPSFQLACQLLPWHSLGELDDMFFSYLASGSRDFPRFGKSAGLAVQRLETYIWPTQGDPMPCQCSHSLCDMTSPSLSFLTSLALASSKCYRRRDNGHCLHSCQFPLKPAETVDHRETSAE